MEKFGINVTKLEYILMCLKNHIVVAKCPKKIPHFDTINYHVYSELFHVYFGFSSNRRLLQGEESSGDGNNKRVDKRETKKPVRRSEMQACIIYSKMHNYSHSRA